MNPTCPYILTLAVLLAITTRTTAQNVSIYDYDVPTSHADSLFLDATYDYQRIENTTLSNDGSIRADYRMFHYSIPLAYSVDINGSGARQWLRDEQRFTYDYALRATARLNKYIWPTRDLFVSLASIDAVQTDDDQPASAVTLGLGVGRFIDATALTRAVRVDRFFLQEGVTSEHLPKSVMLEIARLIDQRDQYRETYGGDTYRQRWYADIEDAVSRSRLLMEHKLGPVGVLRMEEVLLRENIADRFYGAELTLGVRYDVTLADSDAHRPPPRLDLTVRYARPISWSMQLDGTATINSPIDATDFSHLYDVSSSVRFSYEMTNRIDLRVDYGFDMIKPDRTTPRKTSHAILPSFLFYIENNVRLLTGIRIVKPTREPWEQEVSLALHFKAL